jgi:NADH-quinone oxidoreductase subunit M
VLLPLVALAFWIGIYPKPFFNYINNPVDKIVHQINPSFYEQAAKPSEAPSTAFTPSAHPNAITPVSAEAK